MHSAVVLVTAIGTESGRRGEPPLTDFIRHGLHGQPTRRRLAAKIRYTKNSMAGGLFVVPASPLQINSSAQAMIHAWRKRCLTISAGRSIARLPTCSQDSITTRSTRSFARFSNLVDRSAAHVYRRREPTEANRNSFPAIWQAQFNLAAVSDEKIEVRTEGNKERQTVTYDWKQ